MRRLVILCAALSVVACARSAGSVSTATPEGAAAAARKEASEAGFLSWQGEHASALPLFRRAWERGSRDRFRAYDAACSAAVLQEDTEALLWLGRAADLGFDEVSRFREDPRLARVRRLPGYAVIEQRVAEAEAKALRATDPVLRDELLARAMENAKVRQVVFESRLRGETARKKLAEVDVRNTAWLAEVVARTGWPDAALVGPRASNAAWVLASSSDHDVAFQARVITLMEQAVARGQQDSASRLASLTDSVLLNQGKPQRYGTKLTVVDGVVVPKALEDSAGVDARRAGVGLPPLAESIASHTELLKSMSLLE
ncbi:hypothetical protein LXT21_17855 [Myxococcus sp. K38C18041901]|uniref:DUF6624 domain-containing protein n=1 Tax=Myxococcus guangdongensis TaxID=2906760 RepID=UPI0020A75861|nr:DUF6624 domain-containing protein [Myxococcus guangdongensis]MCP3060652.1 hypothetical protein [Myxococcus guangdongensis]